MNFLNNLNNYQIVLASQSPRRQQLLKELFIDFTIEIREVEEVFPKELVREEIPVYLAELKANAFDQNELENKLIITADTIVWINDQILGKPANSEDAKKMISLLSGNMHTVYTGMCLKTKTKIKTLWASTEVYFRKLDYEEIDYYVNQFKPFDKAGSYGIQEWIGFVGIEKISGSYFNVMGLPIQKLYLELKKF